MNFKKGTALYDESDTCHKLFFDIFLNFLSAMVKVLKSVRAEDIKLFAVRGLQAVKIMGTVMNGISEHGKCVPPGSTRNCA